MTRVRPILAATDFSHVSMRTLSRAVELAGANHAEIVVAHVLAPAERLSGPRRTPLPDVVGPLNHVGARRAGQP